MNKNNYNENTMSEYIGKNFGYLTVLGRSENNLSDKGQLLTCKCSCGNIIDVRLHNLIKAHYKTVSCGLCYKGQPYDSFIGFRSGSLVIEKIYSKSSDTENGAKRKYALCKCDCGTYKDFPFKHIINKNTKKCGECLKGKKYNDYVGEKFGTFLIKSVYLNKEKQRYFAICQCEICKKDQELVLSRLITENLSCPNCRSIKLNDKYNNCIGKKYKYCTLIEYDKKKCLGKFICNNCKRTIKRYIKRLDINILNKLNPCEQCDKEREIGKVYGSLTIMHVKTRREVFCRCKCGNEMKASFARIRTLQKKESCGHCVGGVPFGHYIGKTYGYLTIEKIINSEYSCNPTALCKCSCGNRTNTKLNLLLKGERKSCGKCINGVSYEHYIGKTYGYLTIKKIIKTNSKKGYYASCSCKCGNPKPVTIKLTNLIHCYQTTFSCGCFSKKIKSLKLISFGKLKILHSSKNNVDGLRYICKCDCGNEIEVLESDLFTGKVTCCEECKNEIYSGSC